MKSILLLAFAVLIVSAQQGNLLLRKTLDTDTGYFSPGFNFTVTVDIFNVGEGPAYEVSALDDWANGFDLMNGSMSGNFSEIAAGAKESFTFTLSPKQEGGVKGFRSRVAYQSVDGSIRTGYSTNMPDIIIINNDLYRKLTAKHYLEWVVFSVVTAAAVLVPLALWLNIQINFEHGLPRVEKKATKKRA